MNNYLKQQLYILIVSIIILLKQIAILAFLKFDLVYCIGYFIYAFSLMPSLYATYKFFKKLTPEEIIKSMGWFLGSSFMFSMFIFPIIFAPFIMIVNYYKVIRILIDKHKAKNKNK